MSDLFKKFFVDLSSVDAKQRAIRGLNMDGLVTFNNMTLPSELITLAKSLGSVFVQEDTDAEGVKIVDEKAAMQGSGYHTDRASMDPPPNIVLLCCREQADQGGESIFSDAKQIYQTLKINYPEALEAFLTPYSACFGMDSYLSRGAVFNKTNKGNIYIKWRFDDHMYLRGDLFKYFPIIVKLIEKFSISFRLNKYEGYLIQNGRWLHGSKPGIDGKRILHRILINCSLSSEGKEDIELGFVP